MSCLLSMCTKRGFFNQIGNHTTSSRLEIFCSGGVEKQTLYASNDYLVHMLYNWGYATMNTRTSHDEVFLHHVQKSRSSSKQKTPSHLLFFSIILHRAQFSSPSWSPTILIERKKNFVSKSRPILVKFLKNFLFLVDSHKHKELWILFHKGIARGTPKYMCFD